MSKPDKYGIKIVMMNDAKMFYMLDAIPYVGKVETEGNESVPAHYVRLLTTSIHNKSRNVTCNNWFTLVELVTRMLQYYDLTMTGTVRKNKRKIPLQLKEPGEPGSSKFAYHPNMPLVSDTHKK